MKSIAVIGGGVVGLSCALQLAQSNHRVTLIERALDRNAASWGNAGHIAVEQTAPLASLETIRSLSKRLFSRGGPVALPPSMIGQWGPFALRLLAASTPRRFAKGRAALAGLLASAAPAWERMATDLGDRSLVRFDGHFAVWESERSASAGRKHWAETNTGTVAIRQLTQGEFGQVRHQSPAIRDAILFVGSGQVSDLCDLADSLEQALRSSGVSFEKRDASLELGVDGRASVPGISADLVVVAAGVGSAPLMRSVGHRAPLIAERGYHIRSRAFDWPEDMPPLVFEDRSMIVTRFRNCVQASSFVEFGGPDAPPDPRKWQRLERHVAELGLPMRPPFERWIGSRPTLPDYLPAIGRSRTISNLYYAFGHQHLGLTLAPITGELVAALIDGRPPLVELEPFDLARF